MAEVGLLRPPDRGRVLGPLPRHARQRQRRHCTAFGTKAGLQVLCLRQGLPVLLSVWRPQGQSQKAHRRRVFLLPHHLLHCHRRRHCRLVGKTHECSICHKSFPTSQALGGHKHSHYDGGHGAATGVSVGQHHKGFDLNLPAMSEAWLASSRRRRSPLPRKKPLLLLKLELAPFSV